MGRYLIVGGAGFIGANAAAHYARQGHCVTVLDNLSRRGTQENLVWLQRQHPGVRCVLADIRRDVEVLAEQAAHCDVLLHLAAQVAVTISVADPSTDFEINARGTLNILEAARQAPRPPVVLYSSTNKVYGLMENVGIVEDDLRYRYSDLPAGINEDQPLDFHSPYGCSKGAADQYVHDYGRVYGLRAVVFRQSCIYGPLQFGIEDQGWVAWFAVRSLLGKPVTIYGNGKQVRDLLYVDDLMGAFDAAIERIERVAGGVYNIGGGPANTLSLLELVRLLEEMSGAKIEREFGAWRPGDQRVYISNVHRAERELGWVPRTSPEVGIRRMRDWMLANQATLGRLYKE